MKFEDYKVSDIGLSDWGRKEIKIAETEMPGLMILRKELSAEKPLKGANTVSYTHLTLPTRLSV